MSHKAAKPIHDFRTTIDAYEQCAALSFAELLQGVRCIEPQATPFRQCFQKDIFPKPTDLARLARGDRAKSDCHKVQAENPLRLQELQDDFVQSINELLHLLRVHEGFLGNCMFHETHFARTSLP